MHNTTVRISGKAHEGLKKIGKKSDTYDDIILELLEHIETCDRFWETRN